jgi:F-type H+-transporting ATPase subunit delta
MKVSKVATTTARRVFRMCMSGGRLNEAGLSSAVARIAAEKPRGYRGILAALQRLVRLELSRRHVTVESAETLDDATRSRVAAGLQAKYGSGLTFEYRVVPEVIGGLRVRVGDDVWDGTIKGRLEQFARAF